MENKSKNVGKKDEMLNISDEDAHMWGVYENPLSDFDEAHLAGYYKAVANGALKKLSRKERLFWKLAFFKCMAFSDIAKRERTQIAVVYSTIKRAANKLKKMAYKYVYKKPIHPDFTSQGFQKDIRVRFRKQSQGGLGVKDTKKVDELFSAREKLYKKEVQEFYRLHPEEKQK